MLQVLKLGVEDFSPLSQQESVDDVGSPVSREQKIDKAAWERSENADHAMRQLTLEFFKDLHDLLGNNTFYALEND